MKHIEIWIVLLAIPPVLLALSGCAGVAERRAAADHAECLDLGAPEAGTDVYVHCRLALQQARPPRVAGTMSEPNYGLAPPNYGQPVTFQPYGIPPGSVLE